MVTLLRAFMIVSSSIAQLPAPLAAYTNKWRNMFSMYESNDMLVALLPIKLE
jgi:hypothetical protein